MLITLFAANELSRKCYQLKLANFTTIQELRKEPSYTEGEEQMGDPALLS